VLSSPGEGERRRQDSNQDPGQDHEVPLWKFVSGDMIRCG
jgi:hypothetical protein